MKAFQGYATSPDGRFIVVELECVFSIVKENYILINQLID